MSINEIWLGYNGTKNAFQFPVNPESVPVSYGSLNSKVTVAGIGEVSVKNGAPLHEISFSSFFPAQWFQGVMYQKESFHTPVWYDAKIKRWKNYKYPVHLLITDTDINGYYTIESYKTRNEGGDPGSVYFDISLREYKSVKITKVNVTSKSRANNKGIPSKYTTKKNDTLKKIALKFYKESSWWQDIYFTNEKKVKRSSTKKIKAGIVLKLPSKPVLVFRRSNKSPGTIDKPLSR